MGRGARGRALPAGPALLPPGAEEPRLLHRGGGLGPGRRRRVRRRGGPAGAIPGLAGRRGGWLRAADGQLLVGLLRALRPAAGADPPPALLGRAEADVDRGRGRPHRHGGPGAPHGLRRGFRGVGRVRGAVPQRRGGEARRQGGPGLRRQLLRVAVRQGPRDAHAGRLRPEGGRFRRPPHGGIRACAHTVSDVHPAGGRQQNTAHGALPAAAGLPRAPHRPELHQGHLRRRRGARRRGDAQGGAPPPALRPHARAGDRAAGRWDARVGAHRRLGARLALGGGGRRRPGWHPRALGPGVRVREGREPPRHRLARARGGPGGRPPPLRAGLGCGPRLWLGLHEAEPQEAAGPAPPGWVTTRLNHKMLLVLFHQA
mmetsp:Transcript_58305/g.164605  ORF Transcript_58305/g.164605 Transcript_58305/m.164605 type:complete len:372 (-) Transcript_58305:166-1281(-)